MMVSCLESWLMVQQLVIGALCLQFPCSGRTDRAVKHKWPLWQSWWHMLHCATRDVDLHRQ